MAKHALKKNDLIPSRISIFFFYTLLLGGLLWAENAARYHYDYIFRNMLPWLLPILTVASGALVGYLAKNCLKKGAPKEEKIFSPGFLLYMAIPLPALFFFPWMTHFFAGLQLFKLACTLLFFGLVAYFFALVFYYTVKPSAALLTYAIAANGRLGAYFYKMYLSPSRYILLGNQFGYLPGWGALLILLALLVLLSGLALFFSGKGALKMPKGFLLCPAIFTALLLIGLLALDSLLSATLTRVLTIGGIGLELLWLIGCCILLISKKK